MKRVHAFIRAIATLGFALLVGGISHAQGTAPGKDPAKLEEARSEVRTMANTTLQQLYATQPAAKQAVEGAAGHAVFSNVGMKIFVAGSGKGKGIAVDRKTGKEIFMRMVEVQAGLGFGLKKFQLVWVFQTPAAFKQFVDSGYQFGSQATVSAKPAGKGVAFAGAVSVSPGVWVYQLTEKGLAAELTVKGTRYYRDKELN